MWKYFIKNGPSPLKSGYEFKMTHTFEKRKAESLKLREKYPSQYPIIVEKSDTTLLPSIEKKKYLLIGDLTIGQFMLIIRKQLKIDSSHAIFILVDNAVIPTSGDTIEDIYSKHADKDGYLYMTYSAEQTFG